MDASLPRAETFASKGDRIIAALSERFCEAYPLGDQIVKAQWITDDRASYQIRRMRLSVSAANLFDVYPDEWNDFRDGLNAQGASMQGIFRYPGGISPFGMNGRMLYVQLSWH